MGLCVTSSEQSEALPRANASVDCVCDREKVRAVRTYLQQRFPDRPVREFHSHSTVVVDGRAPAACATYHVVSIGRELPPCAVLTNRFLNQPVTTVRVHLRRWNLARALQVQRPVFVDIEGLSQL